jgi:hypothetical protein
MGRTPQAIGPQLSAIAPAGFRTARTGKVWVDYWQMETFLKERGVPLNYSATLVSVVASDTSPLH